MDIPETQATLSTRHWMKTSKQKNTMYAENVKMLAYC